MYHIIIQHAADDAPAPKSSLLRKWAKAALSQKTESAEVTIRIVTTPEMTHLNKTYRYKDGPTNVLSFPFETPKEVDINIPILGDIVVCAEVVNREAIEQGKPFEAHWAHMIVHGVFHLLGYDHENDADANTMETLEKNVLKNLGFENPYHVTGESDCRHD
jgi:probable rRNA maturation factor